ncbi:hypothetical protein AXG93_2175s1370 [Marchantia polymorpha subsp. ruderalis]|uniref:Uncharacterized protein n=1 Tax=Marchantia polymorpha subsp. ruderalis TaxID=1480154 RepID=A0A176W6E0_MARPO|nr:hypothetical protein AXG93_2175s1370 [Marchantia polymorpha subsp. ruderalis]
MSLACDPPTHPLAAMLTSPRLCPTRGSISRFATRHRPPPPPPPSAVCCQHAVNMLSARPKGWRDSSRGRVSGILMLEAQMRPRETLLGGPSDRPTDWQRAGQVSKTDCSACVLYLAAALKASKPVGPADAFVSLFQSITVPTPLNIEY